MRRLFDSTLFHGTGIRRTLALNCESFFAEFTPTSLSEESFEGCVGCSETW